MRIPLFISKAFATLLILVGLFFMLGFFVNTQDRSIDTDDYVLLAILSILPLSSGIFMYIKANKRAASLITNKREQEILRLAANMGGKLTASQLAMNSNLSLDEATKQLNDLHSKGYVFLENADNGALVYDFHELISTSKSIES